MRLINLLGLWIFGKAFLCSCYTINSYHTHAAVKRNTRSDVTNDFRLLSSNSVCDHEMKLLESNRTLTESLENVMVDLESAFNTAYFGSFCKFTQSGVDQSVVLQCAMDYNQFSSEYIALCDDNGGHFHQVTFLANCDNDPLDLQLELVNVPSCLGKSCSSLEINAAILEVVDRTERSLNDRLTKTFKNAKCKFFHDYDMETQPNTYILSIGRDGKVTRERISKDLPAYVWSLIIVGVTLVAILSIVIYKKRNTLKRKCMDDTDDLILMKNSESSEDCFHDNYYHKYMCDAKKEISNLMAAVRIYHEKYNTKYEDVPFDEAIEIEYK